MYSPPQSVQTLILSSLLSRVRALTHTAGVHLSWLDLQCVCWDTGRIECPLSCNGTALCAPGWSVVRYGLQLLIVFLGVSSSWRCGDRPGANWAEAVPSASAASTAPHSALCNAPTERLATKHKHKYIKKKRSTATLKHVDSLAQSILG